MSSKLSIVRIAIFLLFSLISSYSFSQISKKQIIRKPLNLGISQGISTNGVHDLQVENQISLNLLSGSSYANTFLSISGISSYNIQKLKGIHFSGISSVLGGYPFLKRGRKQKDSLAEFSAIQVSGLFNNAFADGNGMQVSGLANSFKGDFEGSQAAGLVNVVKKSFTGAQLSGLGNTVQKYATGLQLSGLYNLAGWLDGFQIAAINLSANELDGVQLGLINFIGNRSSQTYRKNRFYWIQTGAFNTAFKNGDGLQLGLFNYGKNIGFSQIGIINMSKKIPQYPIGLLNIADNTEFTMRYFYNASFPYNIEIGTGSDKLMNVVGYSWNPSIGLKSFSYGLGQHKKMKKYQYFLEYYLAITQPFEKWNSFLSKKIIYEAKAQFGYNILIKTNMDLFLFTGISAKMRQKQPNDTIPIGFISFSDQNWDRWMDFNIGISL